MTIEVRSPSDSRYSGTWLAVQVLAAPEGDPRWLLVFPTLAQQVDTYDVTETLWALDGRGTLGQHVCTFAHMPPALTFPATERRMLISRCLKSRITSCGESFPTRELPVLLTPSPSATFRQSSVRFQLEYTCYGDDPAAIGAVSESRNAADVLDSDGSGERYWRELEELAHRVYIEPGDYFPVYLVAGGRSLNAVLRIEAIGSCGECAGTLYSWDPDVEPTVGARIERRACWDETVLPPCGEYRSYQTSAVLGTVTACH